MIYASYLCLQVISLLSPQAFLDIITQLVTEETVATGEILRKALEILNQRLEENKMRFTAEHVSYTSVSLGEYL